MVQKTYMAKPADLTRQCYLIDAKDKILGRLATRIATLLCGKHKAVYTPNVDTGDTVVVINAGKIRVTGGKLKKKEYQRYSGYPSGQKRVSLETLLGNKPETVIRLAVSRMMPKGRLGDKMQKKLKVYAGEKHPHQAQKPIVLEV